MLERAIERLLILLLCRQCGGTMVVIVVVAGPSTRLNVLPESLDSGVNLQQLFGMFCRQVRCQFIRLPRILQLLTNGNCCYGNHDWLPGPDQGFGELTRIQRNPFPCLKQFQYPGLVFIFEVLFGSETPIIVNGNEAFLINVKMIVF